MVGHKCKEKNLRFIILVEVEDKWINAEGEIMRTEEEEEVPDIVAEELEVECQWMDLSMYSIGGFTQPHTMKLSDRVHNRNVVILINNGDSHNFKELVQELGLQVTPTKPNGLKLGDGNRNKPKGALKDYRYRWERIPWRGSFSCSNWVVWMLF